MFIIIIIKKISQNKSKNTFEQQITTEPYTHIKYCSRLDLIIVNVGALQTVFEKFVHNIIALKLK